MNARGTNRTYEEYDAAVEWSRAAEADAVMIFLPGFKKEEIRVLVDNHGHLRTSGERPVAGNRWSRFQKDFELPADYNVDGIRAKFDNETLTITLPKKNPSPPAPTVPAPTPPQPEPRRPARAPPQRPPQALPELPKPPQPREPAATPVPPTLPPAPSQKPERRPSLPRKPPAPEPAPPPVPEPGSELSSRDRYNGRAATTKPEPTAPILKPKEEEEVKEAKKPLPPATAEEEEKRMERDARRKMEEDRKMIEEKEKKANEEQERMTEVAQERRPISAGRGMLVNVAVAVVLLVGITVYVWHTVRNATAGGDHGHGQRGAGNYSDEM